MCVFFMTTLTFAILRYNYLLLNFPPFVSRRVCRKKNRHAACKSNFSRHRFCRFGCFETSLCFYAASHVTRVKQHSLSRLAVNCLQVLLTGVFLNGCIWTGVVCCQFVLIVTLSSHQLVSLSIWFHCSFIHI